jgi:hypothetical protein
MLLSIHRHTNTSVRRKNKQKCECARKALDFLNLRFTGATTFWGGINFRCLRKGKSKSSNKEMKIEIKRIQMSFREKSTETGDLVRNPVKAIFPFKKPSSLSTSDSIMNAFPILTDTNQITAASSFQMDNSPISNSKLHASQTAKATAREPLDNNNNKKGWLK